MALLRPEDELWVPPAERLDTLPPWPWDVIDPDAPRTLGWHAIAWAEGWSGFPGIPDGWRGLVQPNGPRARQRFRLTQRQKVFRLWWYALDDEGQWLYAYAARRQAKGSGKSPDMAVLCLTEFLGPVRLSTFRRGAPGGVEGRQVDMPWVQIAATAESQTINTMRMVRAFAPRKSHVVDFYSLDPGKTLYYGVPEKTLEVITSSFTAAEGAEASFIAGDELEHWTPGRSGPELFATLADNLAKSGNRMIGTANAWKPGEGAQAEADWNAWLAQEEGRAKGDAGRILYDAVMAPSVTDMADAASLRGALEAVYADCDWKKPHEPDPERPSELRPVPGSKPDVRPIMARIWQLNSRPDDSRRKYLNWPSVSERAWTSPEAWSRLWAPNRRVEFGEQVALFFDGSRTRDATALTASVISDGHVFPIGIWEPDPRHTAEDEIDVGLVDEAVARAFSQYRVLGFLADVREWESFTKVEWPQLYRDELLISAAGTPIKETADDRLIAWDMRNGTHVRLFTHATELTLAEIDELAFTHDGDPVMARHVANCWDYETRYGITVRKKSPDSPDKIDGAVTMIGARMARRLVLAELARRGPEQDRRVRRA